MTRRRTTAAAALIAGLAAACGTPQPTETPTTTSAVTPPTTSAPAPASVDDISFDPCTVASPELLNSLGVDPTPEPYRTEAGLSTMVGCSYKAPGIPSDFFLDLGKNFRSPAVFRVNAVYVYVESIDINGRPATVFSPAMDGNCNVAIPLATGSAVVGYDYNRIDQNPAAADTCPQAIALAETIEPLLPPL